MRPLCLPFLPNGAAVSQVSPETFVSGKSDRFLAVTAQSSCLPAALVQPAPASIHLPGPVWEHPCPPRPQPPGILPRTGHPHTQTHTVGKGAPLQGHTRLLVGFEGQELWRQLQLEAGGAAAVSRRGAAGGEGLLLGRSPSLLRARRSEGAEGWQPPRAFLRRGWSPRRPRAPLPHSGPAGGVQGSGCGSSRGGRAG